MTTEHPQTEQPTFLETQIRMRFIHFRTTYIDKSQRQAAKELEIAQSVLSKAESGERPINLTLLNAFVTKFGMDPTWAITGEGEPKKGKKKTALLSDMATFQSQLDTLQKYIKLMEVKHMKLYSKVEELEGEIEILKKK